MIDVVVSEPLGAEVLTSPDGPIWTDASRALFRIGTGVVDVLPEGAWTLDAGDGQPIPAAPAVVVGLGALEALAGMGLTPVAAD